MGARLPSPIAETGLELTTTRPAQTINPQEPRTSPHTPEQTQCLCASAPPALHTAKLLFITNAALGTEARTLLDRMIAAMGMQIAETQTLRLIPCLPPPQKTLAQGAELSAPQSPGQENDHTVCHLQLQQSLNVQPLQCIVALGAISTQILFSAENGSKPLGQFHTFHNTPVMPIFHPEELLQNPALKREAWSALKQVAQQLNIQLPSPNRHT